MAVTKKQVQEKIDGLKAENSKLLENYIDPLLLKGTMSFNTEDLLRVTHYSITVQCILEILKSVYKDWNIKRSTGVYSGNNYDQIIFF